MTKPLQPGVLNEVRDAAPREEEKRPSRRKQSDRTNITYFLSPAMHKKLKFYAAEHDLSLQGVIDRALGTFFEKESLGAFEPLGRRSDEKDEND